MGDAATWAQPNSISSTQALYRLQCTKVNWPCKINFSTPFLGGKIIGRHEKLDNNTRNTVWTMQVVCD